MMPSFLEPLWYSNENGSHRLRYLNVWFPASGVWEGLGVVLEEVRHWGWEVGFEGLKSMPGDWRDGSGVKSTDSSSEVLSSIPSKHMVAHNHL